MKASDHLLPCPFCGNTSPCLITDADDPVIACRSVGCGAQQFADTRAMVINRWNARALASAAEPVGRDAIETAARIIYDAFPFDGDPSHKTKPAWTPSGNSLMQSRARDAARAVLALPPHKPAIGISDPEPVAWQSRACIGGKWGSWLNMEQSINKFRQQNAFNLDNGTYEVRPLYATPAVVRIAGDAAAAFIAKAIRALGAKGGK